MGSDSATKKKGIGGVFNLEDQLAAYGQYHTNKVNIAIHLLCVPMILQTYIVLLNKALPMSFGHIALHLDPLVIDKRLNLQLDLTLGCLTALGYATYFILLEPIAGMLYAPFLVTMAYISNRALEVEGAAQIAGGLFFVAWVAQFFGHFAHEGRAPALFDNLFQSLVLAVFFVFFEVLFALGYDPALHKRMQNRIGKEVTAWRREQAAKKKKDSSELKGSALRS